MHLRFVGTICAVVAFAGFISRPAGAVAPEAGSSPLDAKAFAAPELTISSANVPLAEVRAQLRNRGAWDALTASAPLQAFIDPRSGAATNILESVPLLPGTGARNRVTLDDVGLRVGRALTAIDEAAVADAVLAHVRQREAVLGIDAGQLGPVRAAAVNPELWQVSIPQRYRGVPVRYGRLVATISHGNLVLLGAETWGDVTLPSVVPTIDAAAALEAGFAHAGGRAGEDEVVAGPALEILPFAPPEHQAGERFRGPVGRGYGHRLVWTFTFERPPSPPRWEVIVDATNGSVLAMKDRNHYAARQIVGGVYPATSTESCSTVAQCGRMQDRWPMPFADTGLPAPNAFANSAGVYDYLGGTARTQLSGRFVRMNDGCNPFPFGGIHESAANGLIDLGGANGDHDCAGVLEGGDTAAARTTYYEANRIAEIARGYLPDNAWLQARLGATVNKSIGLESCNAFWNGSTVNFYGAGGGCRNAGEIASIVDHEWGHGLDQNDPGGLMSNPSEAYADIAALYRTQQSCIGPGLFEARDHGCGLSADGLGFNVDQDETAATHCATDCSGAREADYRLHADQLPDRPDNHVCVRCGAGDGPCGRSPHCAAAPVIQAAWDLARRMNAPADTGYLWASRLFYQGSGNVGNWYACECGGNIGTNGCAAGSGFMQWLATDDDNGDIADGTPHRLYLYHAFDRQGIGCQNIPAFPDSPCVLDTQFRPTLTVTPGVLKNTLTWTQAPGAQRYQVFRSDGHAGCNYGKVKIAQVPGTSFVDTEVATGRAYAYAVMGVGIQSTCFTWSSNCAVGIPSGSFTLACTPQSVTPGPSAATCTVRSTGAFMGPVNLGCQNLPSGSCTFDPPTVTPLPGEPATSTLRIQIGPFTQPGTYPFQVRGVAPPNVAGPSVPLTLTVGPAGGGDLFATFDPELRAPSCGPLAGRSCDSRNLVAGRAQSEPNQPNAIGGCPDGTDGLGSNDRIRLATTDGGPFAPGRKVVISATVDARTAFEDDVADFFFAADAEHPVWQLVGSAVPAGPGPQTLEAVYKLPSGTRQAVRVQFRSGGGPTVCAPGPQDDRDDLVFAVAP
jgi:hypothetical protein